MDTDLPTRGTAHHENYLRYKAQQDALPQPFTASQQATPLQYLPYAHYPETPAPAGDRNPDPIVKIEHDIRYNEMHVYVTALAGTHHSTIAAAALRYVKAQPQPKYVCAREDGAGQRITAGKWSRPGYSGVWKRVGSHLTADTHVRKGFNAWPVPDYTED